MTPPTDSEPGGQAPLTRQMEPSALGATLLPDADSAARLSAPPGHLNLPGYEVLGELGRGGMGVVYKAQQKSLGRLVALKMVLSGAHAGEQELARFKAEAEAIARLQHPNIVQIYEVGEHEGKPFFSLELVGGGSLAERLDGTPLPARQAAELVRTLARAVHSAHECGVVHRDLKPANILLRRKSESPNPKSEPRTGGSDSDFGFGISDLEPKITDFGLAKRVDVNTGQTGSGAILGTPSYMAPEQASGKSKEAGPPADVYALGAILYECLTGRPPFNAATALDTLLQVLERDPVPLRLLNPKVERDLETICLRCLEKEPRRRYPSAAALADDLDRFLRGESISIRSVNLLDRLARALERSNLATEFYSWGTLLLVWAVIVLAVHGALAVWIALAGFDRRATGGYGVQFLLMALAYWRWRPPHAGPSSLAERRLWVVWGGYLLSCALLLVLAYLMPGFQDRALAWGTYPFAALLTGLAFVVLGESHWGWFYAVGLAFFGLALLMPLRLSWAPLEFGLLWAAALLAIGRQLRRLGLQAATAHRPGPGSKSG